MADTNVLDAVTLALGEIPFGRFALVCRVRLLAAFLFILNLFCELRVSSALGSLRQIGWGAQAWSFDRFPSSVCGSSRRVADAVECVSICRQAGWLPARETGIKIRHGAEAGSACRSRQPQH
jgi:hypothetical protein